MGKQSPSQGEIRTVPFVLLGLVLIFLNIGWLIKTEVIWGTLFPTWISLFPNVVFTVFALGLLSTVLERLSPRFAISSQELAIIYVMLSIATALFGRDTMRILFHCVGAVYWYASPENDWLTLFDRYLPDWLVVKDARALESFYRGGERLHLSNYIQVWATPFLIWAVFAFIVVMVMACISRLMHRQAVEYEHLSYPIIQLPLRMIVDRRGFLTSRLMWTGFAIAGSIEVLNGLHFLYPAVPSLRIDTNIGRLFTERPWNAMGWTPIVLYPFAVGLSYVMPLDLSLSCWLFYLLSKAQLVFRAVWGWGLISSVPFLGHQAAGAWLCIGMTWLWVARRHIANIIVGRESSGDSKDTASERIASIFLVAGIVVLVIFAAKTGMALWIAILFFVLYFLIALGVARMRAQLGPPTHDIDHVGPEEFLIAFAGTRRIGAQSLVTFPLFSWLGSWNYRALPIGHQLEGFEIAKRVRMPLGKMSVIMMLAVLLTIFAGPWIFLDNAYQEGIEGGRTAQVGTYFFRRLESRVLHLTGPDLSAAGEICIGFIGTLFLSAMQRVFLGWPLHPLGYAVSSGSYIMNWLWFSISIGWVLKLVMLKYGGVRAYRRVSPLFLGMLLGQFVVGSGWTLLGLSIGIKTYGFFP